MVFEKWQINWQTCLGVDSTFWIDFTIMNKQKTIYKSLWQKRLFSTRFLMGLEQKSGKRKVITF